MKVSQYFHPLFFSVYPVLYLYARHQGTINHADVVLPLLVCFILAAAVLLLFRVLSGDGIKASLSVTVLCFAMFTFGSFDSLAEKFSDTNSVQPLVEMIQNNRLFETLKKWGYRTVAFSSGYSGTEIRTADVYISRSILGREFTDTLVNMTFLAALKLPFFDLSVSQADIHRERIRQTLQEIPELAFAEPVCVFAHIICPHPPFVFAADGKPLEQSGRFTLFDGNDWGSDKEAYRKFYTDQLLYLNRLVKQTVTDILKRPGRPKILVIQSDHGPGSKLDWQNIEKTDLKERFGILHAIYCSDGDYSRLYPEMTPLNTFRIILRRITGEKFESLPDRSFFAPWIGRYRFVEITEKLH